MHLNITKKTKIVCTIGPASDNAEMVRKLYDAGMTVMRINFSHGTYESAEAKIKLARDLEKEGILVPVALDTSRNPHPDPAVRELSDAIFAATGHRPLLPLPLLAPAAAPLPELLARLSEQLPAHRHRLHWQTDRLATGEAWWLRAEEIAVPGQPAVLDAEYFPSSATALAQITITTKNLNAFALKRTWPDFSAV